MGGGGPVFNSAGRCRTGKRLLRIYVLIARRHPVLTGIRDLGSPRSRLSLNKQRTTSKLCSKYGQTFSSSWDPTSPPPQTFCTRAAQLAKQKLRLLRAIPWLNTTLAKVAFLETPPRACYILSVWRKSNCLSVRPLSSLPLITFHFPVICIAK